MYIQLPTLATTEAVQITANAGWGNGLKAEPVVGRGSSGSVVSSADILVGQAALNEDRYLNVNGQTCTLDGTPLVRLP